MWILYPHLSETCQNNKPGSEFFRVRVRPKAKGFSRQMVPSEPYFPLALYRTPLDLLTNIYLNIRNSHRCYEWCSLFTDDLHLPILGLSKIQYMME